MAKHSMPQAPTGYPTRVYRDGINVNHAPDLGMPVGRHLNGHCEWHDSKTMLPVEPPEYADAGDDMEY